MANRSSKIVGQGTQAILTGTKYSVEVPVDEGSVQAQFVVSNEATTASALVVYITDTGGHNVMPVFPQTVVTLETDAPFNVRNDSGSTVNCTIGRLHLIGVSTLNADGRARGAAGGAGGGGGTMPGGTDPGVGPRHYLP